MNMAWLLFLVAGAAAALAMLGSPDTDAWAAQLDVIIDPGQNEARFQMTYEETIQIRYKDGGHIADELRGMSINISGGADSANPDVQSLAKRLNDNIREDGSSARISDLNVDYRLRLAGDTSQATADYRVVMDGTLAGHVIARDYQRVLVDLGWRAMTADGSVVMNGQEINDPLALFEEYAPRTHDTIRGTNAEIIFYDHVINSDVMLHVPLDDWYYFFEPQGDLEPNGPGAGNEMLGPATTWLLPEGFYMIVPRERTIEEVLVADREYVIKRIWSHDRASIKIIGFGTIDSIDRVEIASVTPDHPPESTGTPVGEFPVHSLLVTAALVAAPIAVLLRFAFRRPQSDRGQEAMGRSGGAPF